MQISRRMLRQCWITKNIKTEYLMSILGKTLFEISVGCQDVRLNVCMDYTDFPVYSLKSLYKCCSFSAQLLFLCVKTKLSVFFLSVDSYSIAAVCWTARMATALLAIS